MTLNLKLKDIDAATEAKHRLEEKQRAEARERKEKEQQWETRVRLSGLSEQSLLAAKTLSVYRFRAGMGNFNGGGMRGGGV